MTDPLALAPVLAPSERRALGFNDDALPHDARYDAFVAHVHAGGKIEATDWMPDEYRSRRAALRRDARQPELMGVLPERDWIMRAPTLRRKLALTAKIQDEVGHAQLLYRVAEDLGKPREAMLDDLLAGQDEVPQRLPLPDADAGRDIGVIAWLVDAAAIVAQQALRDSSYAPYARTMQKICWEESVHIMHGRDVVVTLATGTPEQRAMVQEALDRWWPPLMQMHGPRSPREKDRDLFWRIKAKTVGGAAPGVPRHLRPAHPGARPDASPIRSCDSTTRPASGATRSPTGPSCASVVTGHGPASADRVAFRQLHCDEQAGCATRSRPAAGRRVSAG